VLVTVWKVSSVRWHIYVFREAKSFALLYLDCVLSTDVYTLQFSVTVTKSFIDYIRCRPIVFDVFGHAQLSMPESAAAAK